MLIRGLVPLAFVLAVAGPASAEVKSATPTGFEVVTMTTSLGACQSGLCGARGGRPLVEPVTHLLARCRQPQHGIARRRLLLREVEGWRLGAAFAGRLCRAGPGVASARCAWPVADRGRRRDTQLDAETGRGRHQPHAELCRRRLHPQRDGAMGAEGRPGARRAASAPQKLHRGQIAGAIGTLKPTPYP